ncbi:hypothetical protein L4G92_05395 [Neisseria sp. ZJ106]|uniref:Uncharacterized protein n=1 Tax=Neisseria lisongii TaxID=2912188 RepID=A0ABY7RKV1_9NEIS|nr:hypothetical protein [Neisseria lisongii]MCF7521481.1 hypothetical protein [Neisseria lisongii]WCL72270.1 hypothetical protein PJU73_03970 [Neisseria lisongii]
MNYRNMFSVLRNQAGADGDGAGSGTGGQQGLTQADIDAAVEAAVGGLKAKNSELLGKLKTQGEQLKQFEGIDPDAVRLMLKQFSDNEEAELIKAGKFDEAFNKCPD